MLEARRSEALVAGRFALERKLGSGGFATVWLARDVTDGDRWVALKVLHARHRARPQCLDRFLREARLLGQLAHPHIAHARGFHLDAHHAVIVMEYIEGRTLRAVIDGLAARGELPSPGLIGELFRPLLGALSAAHAAGVVHRDLKPANVMVSPGRPLVPKVLDFGVAKELAAGPEDLTTRGHVVGSITYLAPEQIAFAPVDARTDVFALGTILFEVATLRRLWMLDAHGAPRPAGAGPLVMEGANAPAAIAQRILAGPRAALCAYRRDLPRALERVVLRATDADPAARHPSVDALASAFDAAIAEAGGWTDDRRATEVVVHERAAPTRVEVAPARAWIAAVADEDTGSGEWSGPHTVAARRPRPTPPALPPPSIVAPVASMVARPALTALPRAGAGPRSAPPPPPPPISAPHVAPDAPAPLARPRADASSTTVALGALAVTAQLVLWSWLDGRAAAWAPALVALVFAALAYAVWRRLDDRHLDAALSGPTPLAWARLRRGADGLTLCGAEPGVLLELRRRPPWQAAREGRLRWPIPAGSKLGRTAGTLLIDEVVSRRAPALAAAEAARLRAAARTLAGGAIRAAQVEAGALVVTFTWPDDRPAQPFALASAALCVFRAVA